MRTIHRDIVGAFIFSSDNKVLLGQTVDGGVYKGQWIVPGGGLETGETPLAAVRREVLEEIGLKLSESQFEAIPGTSTGQSEKVLRDTGEKVLVKMTFYDFRVGLPTKAEDATVTPQDDLASVRWFTAQELAELPTGPLIIPTLQKLNFI